MSRFLLSAVLVSFALGCGKTAKPPAPEPLPKGDEGDTGSGFPAEVKLPASEAAKPLGGTEEYVYLNVNEQGKVLLPPIDHFKTKDGDTVSILENPAQVEIYLKRRAKEDRAVAGPAGADKPPR